MIPPPGYTFNQRLGRSESPYAKSLSPLRNQRLDEITKHHEDQIDRYGSYYQSQSVNKSTDGLTPDLVAGSKVIHLRGLKNYYDKIEESSITYTVKAPKIAPSLPDLLVSSGKPVIV